MAQSKMNIRRGDKVVVISGKDAGKQGTVLACSPKNNRVVVEGVNIVSKNKKPRSAQDQGGIIKREAAIDASNVMIICQTCGKATRIGHKIVDGKSVRVCKCGAVLVRKTEKSDKKKDKKLKKEAKVEADEKKSAPSQKLDKSTNVKNTRTVKNKAEGAQVKRKQEMQ